MDEKLITTTTIAILFGSFTIGSGLKEIRTAQYTTKEKVNYTKVIDTKAISEDYIDENYVVDKNLTVDEYNHQLDFLNLLQNIDMPQKDVDKDILKVMNNLDKMLWQKTPTKKRF